MLVHDKTFVHWSIENSNNDSIRWKNSNNVNLQSEHLLWSWFCAHHEGKIEIKITFERWFEEEIELKDVERTNHWKTKKRRWTIDSHREIDRPVWTNDDWMNNKDEYFRLDPFEWHPMEHYHRIDEKRFDKIKIEDDRWMIHCFESHPNDYTRSRGLNHSHWRRSEYLHPFVDTNPLDHRKCLWSRRNDDHCDAPSDEMKRKDLL